MEFRKFASLDNSYNRRTISAAVEQVEGPWMVSEKVDGANFAFYANGQEVKVAYRNQFVDGTFFACQDVINEIGPRVQEMYVLGGFRGTLIIYGELYGPSIQGRVNYGDKKGFVAFDIHNHLDTTDEDDEPVCPKDLAAKLCESMGIPFTPILGVFDTLEEALQVHNTFDTLLSPEGIEPGTNTSEGIVIEPVKPTWFGNGKRVYIKNKSPSFSEVKARKERVVAELPESVQELFQEVVPYLTPSRVYSVASKLGEVSPSMFGKLLKLTIQDAVEDFEKAHDLKITEETGEHYAGFMRELAKAATPEVRPVFLDLTQK